MSLYTTDQLDQWLSDLEKKRITPDTLVPGPFFDCSILHALLHTSLSKRQQLRYLTRFIDLGCDVDVYTGPFTPITLEIENLSLNSYDDSVLKYMLQYHKKGHQSDITIMVKTLLLMNGRLFKEIAATGKIDPNTTKPTGGNVLHAVIDNFDKYLTHSVQLIFDVFPDIDRNSLNRKQVSPLAHAINKNQIEIAQLFAKNGCEIIGTITNPKALVDTELVNKFPGDFYEAFPGIENYVLETGKLKLLPEHTTTVFCF